MWRKLFWIFFLRRAFRSIPTRFLTAVSSWDIALFRHITRFKWWVPRSQRTKGLNIYMVSWGLWCTIRFSCFYKSWAELSFLFIYTIDIISSTYHRSMWTLCVLLQINRTNSIIADTTDSQIVGDCCVGCRISSGQTPIKIYKN